MDDKAIWELRCREAWDYPVQLRELHNALGEIRRHGTLRFRVAHRLVELKKQSDEVTPLALIFVIYNLSAPDGRPLYQYRLSDDCFGILQSKLQALGTDKIDLGFGPALFSLWAAEWFRRYHPGGLRKWEDLEAAIGCSRNQNQWRETTRRGMQQLGRPIIKADNFRYFLSTLAREGGFPTAALQADQQSWASDVMRALVATLLADVNPTERRAFELANSLRSRIPSVFCDDDFIQLCADLAMAIVGVRRGADAEAVAAGIPVSAWLDAKKAGWKNQLPVSLDGKSDGLIDQLMSVRPQRVASGHLDAARYLTRIDGEWVEAAVLELNGDVTKAVRQRLAGTGGRLHVYSSGDLARYLPGELGYIDRDESGQCWMQALERRSEMRLVPFRCALDIEIRSSERPEARLRLPGDSNPLRAPMIVLTAEREADGVPLELLVRGTGSGKYRHEVLYVQVPPTWDVRPTSADETASRLGSSPGGTLWRVEGGAVAVTDLGDLYRLICGHSAETIDRIEVTAGYLPSFIRPMDPEVLLVRQPIGLRLLSGSRHVPTGGRLFQRSRCSNEWVRLDGELPCGTYEIAWREGNVIRDRLMMAVLPATADIARWGAGDNVSYKMVGWSEVGLVPNTDAPVRLSASGEEMKAFYQSAVNRTFGATVRWGGGHSGDSCPVIIDFPSGAGLARWDGRIVQGRERISLSDLDDVAAYADGRMEVHGRILDGAGKVIPGTEMQWAFDDEMPLSVIADDLRRAMLPAGLHATAQIGMHDGIETYWRVSQYTFELRKEVGGLVSPIGIIDERVTLCARSLSTYWLETEVSEYNLIDSTNHRPIILSDSLKGPTIAFLREAERVITRPVFQIQPGTDQGRTDLLGRALTAPDYEAALHDFLKAASGQTTAESEKPVRCLVRLATTLRGLPPSAFRVLELLPDYPKALARTLAFASPDERADILSLEMSLPFAWFIIPRETWVTVMGEVFDQELAKLLKEGIAQDAARYAAEKLADLRAELRERHSILCELIFPDQSNLDLSSIMQRFLNRNVDRVPRNDRSIFREALGDRLPDMLLDLPRHCLEVMEAPFAAAAAARGEWSPSREHIARMKLVARRFPTFFGDAFAHCLTR